MQKGIVAKPSARPSRISLTGPAVYAGLCAQRKGSTLRAATVGAAARSRGRRGVEAAALVPSRSGRSLLGLGGLRTRPMDRPGGRAAWPITSHCSGPGFALLTPAAERDR